jgi:sporulation protein YlmC with PRC-barrel domain
MLDRMSRLQYVRHWIAAGLAAASFAGTPVHAADAPVVRATDWLGHVVKTRDGKELGTVRDLGVDAHNGRIVYVVVSVGSFLIENNLIAVAPDALSRSDADDSVLLIDTDPVMLRDAKRFASAAKWPTAPDVLRSENASKAQPAPTETLAPAPAPQASPEGTATIESKSKTAHLSASERYIKDNGPPPPPPPAAPAPKAAAPTAPTSPRPEPITKFDRLDKDGDGVLNRSEFAPVITRKDSYSKIDTNADGVIERNEFDAYEKARGETDQ